jgi:hypothetical protein
VWDMAWSQKADVEAERAEQAAKDDLRPTAVAGPRAR